MARTSGARRRLLRWTLAVATGLLAACTGSAQTLEDRPEAKRGKLQIVDVRVERRRGIGSPDIETALRQKLRAALPVQDEELRTANLVVVIEDYSAPAGSGGGNRASDSAGTSGRIGGRVYLVDWTTGAPLAEFRSSVQAGDEQGPGGTAGQQTGLLDRFAASVIDRIF